MDGPYAPPDPGPLPDGYDRCAYCGAYAADELPPDDDPATWALLWAAHEPGCGWWVSRGRQAPPPSPRPNPGAAPPAPVPWMRRRNARGLPMDN